jgi:hypothetical protein
MAGREDPVSMTIERALVIVILVVLIIFLVRLVL